MALEFRLTSTQTMRTVKNHRLLSEATITGTVTAADVSSRRTETSEPNKWTLDVIALLGELRFFVRRSESLERHSPTINEFDVINLIAAID